MTYNDLPEGLRFANVEALLDKLVFRSTHRSLRRP